MAHISWRKLPNYILLGRVRHPVLEFRHRPTQCFRCGGFGHYAAACKLQLPAATAVSSIQQLMPKQTRNICSPSAIKCVNCGQPHEATSPQCQKWKHKGDVLHYAKANSVDLRASRVAIQKLTDHPAQGDRKITRGKDQNSVVNRKNVTVDRTSLDAQGVAPPPCDFAPVAVTSYATITKGAKHIVRLHNPLQRNG